MPARYTPIVARPDLCERAERELKLRDARAYLFDGRWLVQGRNGRDRWRSFFAVGDAWAEVTSGDGDEIREEFEELVGKLEQGRLL